jgi:hypothetical protein
MKRLLTITLGVLAFFATSCLDRVAGSTSTGNTGKGTISGRVVGADGKGVANARVSVVGVDHNPGPGGSGSIDAIALTGSDGTFRTDSLPDGAYNLLDAKGGQVALVDSVAVDADSGALAGDAVLGAPGTVTGVVRLRPGDDSRTVFLVLIGTTTFTVPKDSVGNFVLAGLAEGEYRLRVLSTLDAYAPLDTVIRVEGGRETVLPDTLRLAYLGPDGLPIFDTPYLEFDSTNLMVRVSWHAQDPSRVAGFYVYRRMVDSGYVRITGKPVKDTFFIDGWDQGFRPGLAYDYAITAQDLRGNEGLKGYASRITTRRAYRIDTVAELANCIHFPCPADVDPAGTVWMISSDTSVAGVTASGTKWKWPLSIGELSWITALRADDSGGIYLLTTPPSRLMKYDTLGRKLWDLALDQSVVCNENCLYLLGDTVLIADVWARTMISYTRNGELLGEEKVLSPSTPTAGAHATVFKPGIGFVGSDTKGNLILLDRDGNEVDRWYLAQHGYVRDFAMDASGRWYLSWSDGRLEVYSADRKYLRTLENPGNGMQFEFRYGALYVKSDWAMIRMQIGL